jgi:hypothetical protein
MVCVNSFVEDNIGTMNDFLLRVASDPNKKPGTTCHRARELCTRGA